MGISPHRIQENRKRIILLGSTGSIGQQTLDVIRRHKHRLELVGLAAHSSWQLLAEQLLEFLPTGAALTNQQVSAAWQLPLENTGVRIFTGSDGLEQLIEQVDADLVVNALSGFAGLRPTLRALEKGTAVALANKEPIVAAGNLIMQAAAERMAAVLPIDSEPSAVWQCMHGEKTAVAKIWLTASGGPFRGWEQKDLQHVTPAMALRHPSWTMGPKITVDSASMMNKGLEVIEAHHFFKVGWEQIKVVVQPRSLVHSLVEFVDGSMLGHLGQPDMRTAIQYALSYPERWDSEVKPLDLYQIGKIEFEKPDLHNFPCLELAYQAGKTGGSMPTVLNAADEEAVKLFLKEEIRFTDIPRLIEQVMAGHHSRAGESLAEIEEIDRWARRKTLELAVGLGGAAC